MKKLQLNSISLWAVGCLIVLTSCSNADVSNEWEYPEQKGRGCITVAQEGSIALRKLATIIYACDNKAVTASPAVAKGQLYGIWYTACYNRSRYRRWVVWNAKVASLLSAS